jgi:putative two-component system response regulator
MSTLEAELQFSKARILVVDDEPANVLLIERLLERWGYESITSTTDSTQVLPLVEQERPHLLLLDLSMPPPDGFEVMKQLAERYAAGQRFPVLVLTADASAATRERALSSGANDFLTKPFDRTEVRLRVQNLLRTHLLQRQLASRNELLEQSVRERTRELDDARREILARLALAGEYRDDATHQHAQRVGRTAALLAQEIGLPEDDVELMRRAAPLHDIGKIGISDAVLLKPGPLTDDEFDHIKTHTTIGADLLADSAIPILQAAHVIALTHHERWDGSGYPNGLRGAEIPRHGRIVAVADVFDALTHERPYKRAWPIDQALAEMSSQRGRHFDPDIIDVFVTLVESDVPAFDIGGGSPLPALLAS